MEEPSKLLSTRLEDEELHVHKGMDEHAEPDHPDDNSDISSIEEFHEDFLEAAAILQSLFSGTISIRVAAETLASLGLKDNDFENGVLSDWHVIIGPAETFTECHQTLSELLVAIASLPPATDNQGKQLTLDRGRFWNDLPRFNMRLYELWSHSMVQAHRDQDAFASFINANKFAAQLMLTRFPVFAGYDFWTLVAMRNALEGRNSNNKSKDPEIFIPAAVVWVSMLGPKMYTWDKEFPHGGNLGDPGRGGPLWKGQHGFCKDRWVLWKQRFLELSESSELSEKLRLLAKDGAAKMIETETKAQ